ncbi:hypothetical protein MACK_003898 [Theileria orientalis]|uniref:Uncharacterized protein n=1 Tax=Theileria orientalis TaxID=68886 RepID=A0A976XIL9_THEOR|nr:hypothetical protein MACK_003898 [Theileria orientalis]
MDDILEYRRKHREAYLKRVASAAASKASETREEADHCHLNSLLSSGVASSTASSLSGGQEGVPRGTLSDSQSSSAPGTLSSSNGKSGALTTADLVSAVTPEDLSDLEDGYGFSTSCKRPTDQYDYERELYDQELSDKTKRDRYKPTRTDKDYESSLELARKLQKEFDSMDEVRKPDVSYKECLLADNTDALHENPDVDLQKAIAKSLIDM